MKKIYLFLITLVCLQLNAQTIVIDDVTLGGLSTSTFQETPIDADDNYSYSQSIYLQSEINQAGTISKITFYTNGPLENSNDIVVYMAEMTDDVFPSTSGWVALGNLTEVFSGTYETYGNQAVIILDTPFAYSNSANLVIAVDENQDGSDTNDFITHNLGFSTGNGRVIHYGDNTTNPDPATPPTGILDYYRPNIEIDFSVITCYPPSGITLTSINENSIDVQWTSTAADWDYVVQPEGTGNPDAGTIVPATNPVNIPGLTSNTAYELYLRSDCDTDGTSDWVGPISFRTGCGIIDDFSENFETLPDELMTPYCWNTIASSTGTAPTFKVNTSASQAYSPDNYYEISMNDDDNLLLVSPESYIIADGNHRVEFAAKVNSLTAGVTYMKVGLMSDPNDSSTFVELSNFELTTSSSYTNNYSLYYVNIPLSTNAYLAFKPETTATSNRIIYLDEIVVTTQPACFEVLDVTADNITDISFDLNLTPDTQVQTEWELVVVQTSLNFNPALETPIITSSLSTNITTDSDGAAIIPNSPYRIFVRANCDAAGSEGSGFSTWYGPYDIRTACAPLNTGFIENFDTYSNGDFPFCWNKITNSVGSPLLQVSSFAGYANSGSNTIIMNTGNDANANVLLILPQSTVANDGAHRLEFYAKSSSATTLPAVIVGTMSDPMDANTFEEVTSIQITTGTTSGANVQYYVNLPANINEYVVLKHGAGSASSAAIYFDDIAIVDQPACPEVLNIIAENVTASSVEVSWDFVGSQTDWEYVVQEASTGEPTSGTVTSTNSSNADFNSLMDNTTYEIYVRANCDTDGFSAWAGPINFTTVCVPASDTFSESFEGFDNNAEIEPCWSSLIDPASTSPYVRYSTVQAQDGTSSVRFYSGNDVTAGIFLVSPLLSDFDFTKQISFYVYDNDNGGLEVGTMSDPTDASTFTSYQTFLDADMTDDTWEEKIVTFENYAGSDTYIAFKYNPATTFDYFYIDNVTYEDNETLSIGSVDIENSVSIYPNPVKDILHINARNVDSIEVFGINGQRILSQSNNVDFVDVSNLETGMYFINIRTTNGATSVKKFIKQ
ncbi:choice-of-anchor J domain-containing protein [Subsaxibacter sp. CAU 1640]|uniref:T9SS-dependent choice-of-anchor J family protein n=1 Tax=Subsaxibacter sp. CAU 1640 TaxID=2933271 RepID=UPI002003113A|nr:choice-of-anchor J domain-containing protein [Subsaxibacter sp. CAU 1640]MCK7590371.1 choice-of-anchor J domain-containing protein [Subsaxibacter sp. CAU 1640]